METALLRYGAAASRYLPQFSTSALTRPSLQECYEALWDDLLQAENGSFKIRAIWMADAANQGASYQLNGEKLGDDPGWFDHARDLLLMMNHFRENMQPPFVGLAHSMGCANMYTAISFLMYSITTNEILGFGYPSSIHDFFNHSFSSNPSFRILLLLAPIFL